MSSRVLLVVPARRFIANRFGLGYQVPLGMVLIGGPLIDAGHTVRLIDNDVHGWSPTRLGREAKAFAPDCILVGHTGSTAAHPVALETAVALRAALPGARIVYGGVYPTYASEATLRDCAAVDVVVRGEGEQTALDLVRAFEEGTALSAVEGISYRDARGEVRRTASRPPIDDLDAYRAGWELVDWPRYSLYGMGRAAGVQFSRGCPLTCTYCGQWMFWKRWRHRSPERFVADVTALVREHGVKIVWLADENFAADREVTRDVLERLVQAKLDVSLNVNMTAADVVRDADLLPLYKAAGVDYVVMGIEAVDDDVVASVRKNNPFDLSCEAVRLLREHGIISLANLIYGLEMESPETLRHKLRRASQLDPDILNAVYLTPHFWTHDGRATDPGAVIQADLARWTYRNQVVHTQRLTPAGLFWRVKATELRFHTRVAHLARLFVGGDRRVRRILRSQLFVGVRVFLAEVVEFLFLTRFVSRGSLARLPGQADRPADLVRLGRHARAARELARVEAPTSP